MKINCVNIAVFILVLMSFGQTYAQSDNTYVATTGVDSTTCGATNAPCRTFVNAISKTNAGGVVTALDSGVYSGSIQIDRSITLAAAPGARAEISNDGNVTLVSINLGPNDSVVLENLVFKRPPTGGSVLRAGIAAFGFGSLSIEKCSITGFSVGIQAEELSASTNQPSLSINDTVVDSNQIGIIVDRPNGGKIRASINHSRIESNSQSGLAFGSGAKVVARDTVAAHNIATGFDISSSAEVNLKNCEAFDNNIGVSVADTSGRVIVANSTVTNNNIGFQQLGASIFYTFNNNVVRVNGTNKVGTFTDLSGT